MESWPSGLGKVRPQPLNYHEDASTAAGIYLAEFRYGLGLSFEHSKPSSQPRLHVQARAPYTKRGCDSFVGRPFSRIAARQPL